MASLEAPQAASKNSSARMASDHAASVESFANELKALADATQVLLSETGGADGQTYSSFQESAVAGLHTSSDLKGFEVVAMVKKLARKSTPPHSPSPPRASPLS